MDDKNGFFDKMRTEDSHRGMRGGYRGGERGYYRGGRGGNRQENWDGNNNERRHFDEHPRGGDGERGFGGDRRGGRGGRGSRPVFTNNDKRDEQTFGAMSKDFKLSSETAKPKKQYFKDDTVPQQQTLSQWQAKTEQSASKPKTAKNRFAGMDGE